MYGEESSVSLVIGVRFGLFLIIIFRLKFKLWGVPWWVLLAYLFIFSVVLCSSKFAYFFFSSVVLCSNKFAVQFFFF